jgi:hypothetical protein
MDIRSFLQNLDVTLVQYVPYVVANLGEVEAVALAHIQPDDLAGVAEPLDEGENA